MSTRIVAIVPARDEARVLPLTLPQLFAQAGALDEILLVDDESTDGTADVARDLAREDGAAPRLEILQTGPRPAGWSGKVFAQHCAYLHLARRVEIDGQRPPDWVLLTDADIRHPADSVLRLQAVVDAADSDERLGLVSVMARLRAESVAERLVVPSFVFFFQLLYPFAKVARPHSPVAAAAGGCILLRWDRLSEMGGFESLRGAIIDDVALAKAVKRPDAGIWLGFDADIESLRSYPRLRDLWRMVARTAFAQLGHSWAWLGLTLVALSLLLVSVPITSVWSLVDLVNGGWQGHWSALRTLVWSALTWILMFRALLPSVRHHRVPQAYALLLPVAAALFGAMTLSSAWNHAVGRGSRWRGRWYGKQGSDGAA